MVAGLFAGKYAWILTWQLGQLPDWNAQLHPQIGVRALTAGCKDGEQTGLMLFHSKPLEEGPKPLSKQASLFDGEFDGEGAFAKL